MHGWARRHLALGLAVTLVAIPGAGLSGQIDYRNLDDDRPTRVEDAYPAERYAFELLLPYALERERGDTWVHASVLELEYGIARNTHVGLKAPLAVARESGASEAGLSGLRAFALYNFNTESRRLPALSLRADAAFPVGSLGGSETRASLTAIATRSFGRNRLHVNAAYGFGQEGTPALVEGLPRWWYGAALDRTLFRQSVLVVAEVYALKGVEGAPVEVNASLGLRWQWRPTDVLDLGISRGLRRDLGPEYAFTVGISHAFAIAGLMPRGR